jgi:hypothetical protein
MRIIGMLDPKTDVITVHRIEPFEPAVSNPAHPK